MDKKCVVTQRKKNINLQMIWYTWPSVQNSIRYLNTRYLKLCEKENTHKKKFKKW